VTARNLRRGAFALLGVLLAGFLLLQLVPYGRDHTNPPVVAEPAWDSPRTRALAVRACFDCHSNETRWPWYSWVAPVSWAVQRHVDEGRAKLNWSEWGPRREGEDAAETVEKGSMPPSWYPFLHLDARLSEVERRQLIDGLLATFGGERGDGRGEVRGEEREGDD